MAPLQRLYKGFEGDCHSWMASGAARKLRAGNLMHLKPSYTHSIHPRRDPGTSWEVGGGALLCAESQFYLKWHLICSWLTSWAFIMASTESTENALPVSYLGSFSQPLLNLFGTHLPSHSNWILSVLSAWSKGFVTLAHHCRWLFIINLTSEVCLNLVYRSNNLIAVSLFRVCLARGGGQIYPKSGQKTLSLNPRLSLPCYTYSKVQYVETFKVAQKASHNGFRVD